MDVNRYLALARNLTVTVKVAIAFWLLFVARVLLA
jgi:hypothetical protein